MSRSQNFSACYTNACITAYMYICTYTYIYSYIDAYIQNSLAYTRNHEHVRTFTLPASQLQNLNAYKVSLENISSVSETIAISVSYVDVDVYVRMFVLCVCVCPSSWRYCCPTYIYMYVRMYPYVCVCPRPWQYRYPT
jgi:hypothetical protein